MICVTFSKFGALLLHQIIVCNVTLDPSTGKTWLKADQQLIAVPKMMDFILKTFTTVAFLSQQTFCFVHNTTLSVSNASPLDLWYALEISPGYWTPWHHLGPISSGSHDLSMITSTDITGTLEDSDDNYRYYFYLAAYGDGSSHTLSVTGIVWDEPSDSCTACKEWTSTYDWVCDASTDGCCVVGFRFTQDNNFWEDIRDPCNDYDDFESSRETMAPTPVPS